MPVTIKNENKGDYLLFHVEGSKSLEDGIALWKEISQITKAGQVNKILVIENIAGELSDIEMVDIVNHFHEIGLTHIKIAYIDAREVSIPGLELAALFGKNRGIEGQIFSNQDEALAWLRA